MIRHIAQRAWHYATWLRYFFFFSSRRRHTRLQGDWSSDVCSSDLREHAPERYRMHDLLKLHAAEQAGAEYLDRKSTRLNSSHLVISYAVFCLKKKKIQPDSSFFACVRLSQCSADTTMYNCDRATSC